MTLDYDPNELDTDTAVSLLNKLAREHPRVEGPRIVNRDEFSPEDFEYYAPLTDPIGTVIVERTPELFEETTFLSEEEAHVVAMKELGLTHNGISMYYDLTSEGAAKSTIDEYSRRARQKYLKAERTVNELESLYGSDE